VKGKDVVNRFLRFFIVTVINLSLICLPLANVNAAEELALPSGDLDAPEIKSPELKPKVAPGEPTDISVTVTDNVGVKSVILFYRDVGASDFKRLEMSRTMPTNNYSVTLPTVPESGIEYYIQASDLAGNTILHGHTFSPLTIAVTPKSTSPEDTGEAVALVPVSDGTAVTEPAKKGISKWVWIGLGVLVLGAAAGGGGGGGGGDTTTSTLTISGPTP